jgi:hypothetical protein
VIDDLGKLLDRVSSPADLAVVLLMGPLAYLLDAGVDVIGFLPPGYVAIITASFALGVKKTVELRTMPRRERRTAEARRREVLERATALEARIAKFDHPSDLMDRLRLELDLYEDGITSEAEFDAAFVEVLAGFRLLSLKVLDS